MLPHFAEFDIKTGAETTSRLGEREEWN